jgi:hypothetical protein
VSIQYRYARNVHGGLVDVQGMQPTQRGEGAPFSCLSCGRELVPALGEIQAHHFRHKQEQDCSSETYRHQLAKLVFVAEYERCLREGRPFHLVRSVEGTCSFYAQRFGFTCTRTEPREHDLTRWFDEVAVEEVREGFRADVLLWSKRHEDYLFIEMAVTHTCEPEKQESGIRIIELSIGTEDDALALGTPAINADGPGITLYNFQDDRTPVDCGGKCSHPVSVFAIYPNGSAALRPYPAREVAAPTFLSRVPHKEVLTEEDLAGEEGWRVFRRKIREAHFGGTRVCHCFMCRYHGADRYGAGIWCKVKKRVCESNEGATCDVFKALRSQRDCDEADRANEKYLQDWSEQRRKREGTRRPANSPEKAAVDAVDTGLAARADIPKRTRNGRGRIHWSGSALLDSLQCEEQLHPPVGTPRLGQVVDFYLPRRGYARHVVWLTCWTEEAGAFAILRSGRGSYPLAFVEADDAEAMEEAVHQAFDYWCSIVKPEALVVDSPMDWSSLVTADPPIDRFPLRYRWSLRERGWIADPRFISQDWNG